MSEPDALTSLSITWTKNKDEFNITWSDGLSDGGRAIIDYTIYSDEGKGDFTSFDTVKTQYYVGLVAKFNFALNTKYAFKVSARNSVGMSNLSPSLLYKTERPTAVDNQPVIRPPPRIVEPEPKKPADYQCTFYEHRDYRG